MVAEHFKPHNCGYAVLSGKILSKNKLNIILFQKKEVVEMFVHI